MKSISSFIILACLFFSFSLFAQNTFSKVYQLANNQNGSNDGLYNSTIINAPNDGCFIAGGSASNGILLRLDSLGNILWGKVLNSGYAINDIVANLDTTYYLLVSENTFNNNNGPVILKVDAHGLVIWSKSIAVSSSKNYTPFSICTTVDSGVVVCGSVGQQLAKTSVIKLDKSGTMNWSTIISVRDSSTIYRSIKLMPDSGFILAGTIQDRIGSLLKLDQTGSTTWCKSYAMANNLSTMGLDVVVRDNKLYSYFKSNQTLFMVNDLSGNFISAKKYDLYYYFGSTQIPIMKMKSTQNKGFLMINADASPYLYKIDSIGNFEWSSSSERYGKMDAIQLHDKGFITLGDGPAITVRTSSFIPPQIGLVKLDSLGNGTCAYRSTSTTSIATLSVTPETYTQTIVGTLQTETINLNDITITQKGGCIDVLFGGIHETNDETTFHVFPNPASNEISISFERMGFTPMKYSLLTLNGKIIKEGLIKSNGTECTMDVSSIPSGVYILQLTSNDRSVYHKKIVVNR